MKRPGEPAAADTEPGGLSGALSHRFDCAHRGHNPKTQRRFSVVHRLSLAALPLTLLLACSETPSTTVDASALPGADATSSGDSGQGRPDAGGPGLDAAPAPDLGLVTADGQVTYPADTRPLPTVEVYDTLLTGGNPT